MKSDVLTARELFNAFTSRSRILLAERDARFCDEVLGYKRDCYSADTINELYRLCEAYAAKAKRKGGSV